MGHVIRHYNNMTQAEPNDALHQALTAQIPDRGWMEDSGKEKKWSRWRRDRGGNCVTH